MTNQANYQTGFLVQFLIKRERMKLLIWVLSFLIVTISTAVSLSGLYQSDIERQTMAETMKNPAMSALVGQGYGLENYTNGAMMAHQMLLMTAVVVAIMNILLVVRLTRADEEDGQLEMLRALPIGRLAPTNAVMFIVLGTNIFLSLVIAAGLAILGIESIDLAGSLLYGVVLGVTGIFFAAVTMLFAQLSDNARGTMMLSFTVLGIAYFIRAVGDAGNTTVSWFSPLGWILGTEVYVNNYWWPILLTLFIGSCIFLLALYLNHVRDIGAGLLPSRRGKKHASRLLQTPIGLSLRLQRTPIIAWLVGVFVIGASYGSVLGDLGTFFEQNDMIRQMLASDENISLTEQFLSMLMVVMAIMATIPVIMSILKIRGEEKKQRTEHLLARDISRKKLLLSYVIIAFVISFLMLLVSVIGLASTGLAVLEIDTTFSILVKAMLVYLPALWVILGVAVFIFGVTPRFTSFSWFYLLFTFVVVYLGELLEFPEWISNLSPFAHIPELPVDELTFTPLITLTIIAIALTVVGFFGYQKRDIQG
ncbi:ABC transporter permease [Paraliobacillus sp. JSM ZJ581]|uniref:ABC transporter permease n=1 Tax=Paraliobacillus sp. JSM ZJ581 TaxID=3342118 RepID=UPI0035A90240